METNSMKKNLSEIDYNNSSETCLPCVSECKKINSKINGRKLSNIKKNEMNKILKIFNIQS